MTALASDLDQLTGRQQLIELIGADQRVRLSFLI